MNKKSIFSILGIILTIVMIIIFYNLKTNKNLDKNKLYTITGTILSIDNNIITIEDSNNIIYSFKNNDININAKENIELTCLGNINKDKDIQECDIVKYNVIKTESSNIPAEWMDNGIFKDYYEDAYTTLNTLTLDEKINQLIMAHYDKDKISYSYGSYIFFAKDFKDKNKEEVITMIQSIQNNAKIPYLMAVDEEGGRVVRISSNSLLRDEKFKSPQELYKSGGFNIIKQDVLEKSSLLSSLGINLNLAPVVDISTDENDYIYSRTLGENATLTSIYAKIVIETSKDTSVSYTLKHFPGYGNNLDTHTGTSIDSRTYESIMQNDIIPFKEGINEGAEAVMVSHNVVTSIDSQNPASISKNIHNILRDDLKYSGIIITDDINMGALKNIDNIYTKAILAGNDIIITSNPNDCFQEIKSAINNNIITEEYINRLVFRILSWKYYKKLL